MASPNVYTSAGPPVKDGQTDRETDRQQAPVVSACLSPLKPTESHVKIRLY